MTMRPPTFRLNYGHPLAQGLVFAGLGAHAGGTHYHDSGPYGRHGTLGASVSWSTLSGRRALLFATGSPSTAFVQLPNVIDLQKHTITMRLKAVVTKATAINWLTDYSGYGFYRNLGSTPLCKSGDLKDDLGSWVYGATASVPVGLDVEFLSTTYFEATGTRLLVNGSQVQTNAMTGIYDPTYLAYLGANTANSWDGFMSDVLVHDRILSAAEVNILSGADPLLGGLILTPARKWWPVVSGAAPAASYWIWAKQHQSQVIGGGAL